MWYLLVKWLHVLAAIVAVGANLTYRIWLGRASQEPKVLPFVLATIRLIDQREVNPCYAVVLGTGLILAFTASIPLTTPWLLTSISLYVLAALLGIFAYAPLAKRQREILAFDGFESAGYKSAAQKGTGLGLAVTIDVLIIVFLMIVKPALWG
jgi:uncharacterized membrane protein